MGWSLRGEVTQVECAPHPGGRRQFLAACGCTEPKMTQGSQRPRAGRRSSPDELDSEGGRDTDPPRRVGEGALPRFLGVPDKPKVYRARMSSPLRWVSSRTPREFVWIGLVIAFAVTGWFLHSLARTDTPVALRGGTPLDLQIYSESPRSDVSVQLDVNKSFPMVGHAPSDYHIALSVGGSANQLMLVSNVAPRGQDRQWRRVQMEGRTQWARYLDVDKPVAGVVEISEFAVASRYVQVDAGRGVAASLPTIAQYQQPDRYVPVFGVDDPWVGKRFDHFALRSMRTRPPTKDPTVYGLPRRDTLFWEPAHIRSTVILRNVGNAVSDAQLQVSLPSSGTLVGNDYVWTGGFGLSPRLLAENLGYLSSRSNLDFLAGLALGLAGAALIELVSELSREVWLSPPAARTRTPRASSAQSAFVRAGSGRLLKRSRGRRRSLHR
jgi:hypothetical protein